MESGVTLAVLSVLVVVAAAFLVAELAARLTQLAFVAVSRRDPVDRQDPVVRRPVRIVRSVIFATLTAVLVVPAVRFAGANLQVGLSPQALSAWLLGSGLRIIVIATGSYVLVRIIDIAARRLERRIEQEAAPDIVERGRRARTLGHLLGNVLTTITMVVAVLMILRELRVDITPILTGAGIAGLAVGFGAQALVRDIISGFFLIIENQLRVGDAARINGTPGTVEQINLRTVVLRDDEGTVHVFPNGLITQLANRSKDYSFYVTDVAVAARHPLDEVTAALGEAGERLRLDPHVRPALLAPLEVMGVEALRGTQVIVRIRIRTLPLGQWDVGRALLRQIKTVFDERGIGAA